MQTVNTVMLMSVITVSSINTRKFLYNSIMFEATEPSLRTSDKPAHVDIYFTQIYFTTVILRTHILYFIVLIY